MIKNVYLTYWEYPIQTYLKLLKFSFNKCTLFIVNYCNQLTFTLSMEMFIT